MNWDIKGSRKLLILISFFVVAITVGLLFFLFYSSSPKQNLEKNEVALPVSSSSSSLESPNYEITEQKAPVYEIFQQEEQKKADIVGDISEESLADFKERMFGSISELQTNLDFSIATAGQTPTATLAPSYYFSNEEYFTRLYGEDYLKKLNILQDFLVSDGFMKVSDRITFKTEADAYKLFNVLLDFALSKNYITAGQEKNLRQGVNVELKYVNQMERQSMEKMLREELGFNWQEFFNQLVIFMNPVASAQEVSIGVECYRMGGNPAVGYNTWTMCCNCGFFCSYGCTYFQDCGPSSVNCNVPMGCLNSMCFGMAAIYDPTTGICGCG